MYPYGNCTSSPSYLTSFQGLKSRIEVFQIVNKQTSKERLELGDGFIYKDRS